jgi:hypothetical protein
MARRRRDDRGSTLVEAAFVMPVFVMLVFGIFEFSGYVMAETGASAAAKAGARMATVQGSDPMADRSILSRMVSEGAGITQDHIEQIIIWRVNNPNDSTDNQQTPPQACLDAHSPTAGRVDVTSSPNHPCTVYNQPQDAANGAFAKSKLPLTTDETPTAALTPSYADYWFGCDSTNDAANVAHKLDCGWEPGDRRDIEKSPAHIGACTNRVCDSTDVVGIYIWVKHSNYTSFFGSSKPFKVITFAAIEPQGYDE